MIFGECPYCSEPFALPCPAKMPAFRKETCESCHKEFWERYSSFDPCCYTLEEFAAEYDFDDATMTIAERNPKPSEPIDPVLAQLLCEQMADLILHGKGSGVPSGLLCSITKKRT